MKKLLIVAVAALACGQSAASQQKQGAAQAPAQQQQQQSPQQRPAPQRQRLDLSDFGMQIAPDARLVVMMAALDAAGWDPTPAGERPSVFRELVRKDQAGLDPALRARLQDFYKRNALKDERATPADQAARYVSLAYTLGQPPSFEAPPRSDDLPPGVLDVLDFVPLLREFYRQSGIDARLPSYLNSHRAAGDGMRRASDEMARFVLSYLSTRPETTIFEQVRPAAQQGDKKKGEKRAAPVVRERQRRFVIVPDLLAAPGAINFRVVGDDYFAVVPAGTDPRWSEVRRAYVQFVIDPLVLRFNRDVAARRADIKLLLDTERARRGGDITPDVFLSVARSLVAAADARMDEVARLYVLQNETGELLKRAGSNQSARDAALRQSKEREASIKDSTVAQLAEAYERGAVLSFHFADELKELEGSGFDVAAFITPMLADFDPQRELKRPAEYAAAVARAAEARRRAREARAAAASSPEPAASGPADERRAALLKSLADVDDLMRLKNYEEAEARLLALRDEHRDEPRVYFALGQVASLAAQEAFDEGLQAQRLDRALQHFRQALLFASPGTDRALMVRAHMASGRILAHLERAEEAAKEFDAVMQLSEAADPVHQEALAAKKRLPGQKQ
ncbi:MAG TPA: hypothetical protein VD968_09530 [Pyrinomonadaceae bacterium]|nr:hypothetical protein [Pyrinomonadaceae bacterium]